MKILIVEDDPNFIKTISQRLLKLAPDIKLATSICKEQAIKIIDEKFFDLIILDLSIPTHEDSFDEDPAHGHAVFTHSRNIAPGTPIIVLTGSSGENFISSMLQHTDKNHIWGNNNTELSLVAFHKKFQLDSLPKLLASYINNYKELKDIELITSEDTVLLEQEDRLLRIFTRYTGGVISEVTPISGGLSGTKVLKVKTTAENGSSLHDAVCKLGKTTEIKIENNNYDIQIIRLQPNATPRKIALFQYGSKDYSGIFYGLATGCDHNAFTLMILEKYSEELISNLKQLLSGWSVEHQERKSIKEIRECLISDNDFALIQSQDSLNINLDLESKKTQVKWGTVHGDLHGLNVLTTDKGIPILIDYGDIKNAPKALDPITLEFSLFCHPNAPFINGGPWPTKEQAQNWSDLDAYLINCPIPSFIRECRSWAKTEASGDREIAALVYSYMLRQLKYDSADASMIKSFLQGAIDFLNK